MTTKRYRYIGKERDDESGFYYMGARYYCPWLARWLAPDPINNEWYNHTHGTPTRNVERHFLELTASCYEYCYANPIRFTDPAGEQAIPSQWTESGAAQIRDAAAKKPVSDNTAVDGTHVKLQMAAQGAQKPEAVIRDADKVAAGTTWQQKLKAKIQTVVHTDINGQMHNDANPYTSLITAPVNSAVNLTQPYTSYFKNVSNDRQLGEGILNLFGDVATVSPFILSSKSLPSAANKNSPTFHGTGPRPGVLEISSRVKSTKAFENLKGKTYDFVYEPSSQTMSTLVGKGKTGGHSYLAGADNPNVVGGRMTISKSGTVLTNEWSGHFGDNWNNIPGVRENFIDFMKSYNFNIKHHTWSQSNTPHLH